VHVGISAVSVDQPVDELLEGELLVVPVVRPEGRELPIVVN